MNKDTKKIILEIPKDTISMAITYIILDRHINDEVEILDEFPDNGKTIKKFDRKDNMLVYKSASVGSLRRIDMLLVDKINEIIDELNKRGK